MTGHVGSLPDENSETNTIKIITSAIGHYSSGGVEVSTLVLKLIPINEDREMKLHVGTWNFKSMFQTGKTASVLKKMKRSYIDVVVCIKVL